MARGWAARRAAPLAAMVLAACTGAPPPHAEPTALPPGAVAACAGATFPAEAVEAVSARQGVTPKQAVERLAAEARLARRADDLGLARSSAARVATRATYARALLTLLKADASSRDPTEAELTKIRADHWAEFDHPDLVRVVHAVVIAKPDDPKWESARVIARAIADATRGSATEEAFAERARAVAHEGIDVRIEKLEPVTKDGRVTNGMTFDLAFSVAAHQLGSPNDEIGPVVSKYGFHVIHLLERIAARRVPDVELASIARDEIVSKRGFDTTKHLVDELRARTAPLVERSVDEILRTLDAPSTTP